MGLVLGCLKASKSRGYVCGWKVGWFSAPKCPYLWSCVCDSASMVDDINGQISDLVAWWLGVGCITCVPCEYGCGLCGVGGV